MTTALLTPIDDATRRQFLTGLAATGLLAGCATPAPAASGSGAPTRRVTDDLGVEVELPERPQRIVTLSGYGGAAVLEAGGALVGTVFGETQLDEDLRSTYGLDGVADVGAAGEPNLEAIAAATPDLIIAQLRDGAPVGVPDLDVLRAIAPVFAVELFQSVDETMDRTVEVVGGDATGQVASARAEFEATIGELRALLAVPGPSTSFVVYAAPDAYTYGPQAIPPVDVLTRAGAVWLPIADEARAAGGDLQLSVERLGELSADLVVVYNLGDSDLAGLETFAALPAARAGQVVELPRTHNAVTWHNYSAFARSLTDLLRARGPLSGSVTAES